MEMQIRVAFLALKNLRILKIPDSVVSVVHRIQARPAFLKLWSADQKWSSGSALVVFLYWTLIKKKDRKNKINVNCASHTVVENLKQFAFWGDKSRVVRRTFQPIKVVPTWKKFEKRWARRSRSCDSNPVRRKRFLLSGVKTRSESFGTRSTPPPCAKHSS
jgi:hypothetical protein